MSLEFLMEMAWKSALIAGVALALAAALRSRAAADRSTVLRVAVTLLLLLPLFSLALPKLQVEAWAPEPAQTVLPASSADFAAVAPATQAPLPRAAEIAAPPPEATIWDDPTLLFLILYLGGVAMAAARLGAGLWTLRRWTRGAEEVDVAEWNEALERARWAADARRGLRLLVSAEAPSPLSWGFLRPVILIDRDTLGQPEDADAILAHEVAHVVRRDWAVLMLTRIAAALFWFNPLVWLLEREVVQQAEEAADIEASFCVEPARYAQTLVHWAQFNAGALVPANSIAPSASALTRRVRAILDARRRTAQAGSPWALAATAACALFAVTLAVLQLIPAAAEARHMPPAPRPPAPVAVAIPPAPVAPPGTPLPPGAMPALVVIGAVAPAAPEALPAKLALHPHAPPAPPPHAPHAPPAPLSAPHPVVPPPFIDEAAIQREVEAAVAAATRLSRVETRRIAAQAAAAARRGIAAGAAGIERGAEGLSDGARRMEQEATRLGSRDYRERRIAEAAARGEHLTHDELLELSRDLRDGARGMREGSREMRRAAVDMRRHRSD